VDEEQATGSVPLSVYRQYVENVGSYTFLGGIFLVAILAQVPDFFCVNFFYFRLGKTDFFSFKPFFSVNFFFRVFFFG
jgi:hypothetical protein